MKEKTFLLLMASLVAFAVFAGFFIPKLEHNLSTISTETELTSVTTQANTTTSVTTSATTTETETEIIIVPVDPVTKKPIETKTKNYLPETVTELKTTVIPTTIPETTTKKKAEKIFSSTDHGRNLGRFKITVYVPYSESETWGYATSTGTTSKHLATCAVDPSVIPLYSTIYVNGLTLYCCDIGNGVQGNVVDIFYDGSVAQACAWAESFGEYHTVYLVK